MKGVNVFKVLFYILFPVILVSFGFWYFQEEMVYNIYVLDKTVPDKGYSEHKSFFWLLNYHKIVNKNGLSYSYKYDYYGFHPDEGEDNSTYKIKSLRLYEILGIPDDIDFLYYIDSYGVSYEDWYHRPPDKFHSPLLYGGLNQNDYLLLNEMKRKNKLIISEFNMLGSPTSDLIRNKTENLFDFYWTGWTGCYFRSLHSSNPNLPRWVINQYEQKYSKKWDFDDSGIVFIQENGNIVVLQNKVHLTQEYPQIITDSYGQKEYYLPPFQNYCFWFDIILPGKLNRVISKYHLSLSSEGIAMLKKEKIPAEFPAVLEHLDHYKFYYLAGDFSDLSVSYYSSFFSGFPWLAKSLYLKSSGSKRAFYWRYYVPLLYHIIEKNVPEKNHKNDN
jgi:hypothetical protein